MRKFILLLTPFVFFVLSGPVVAEEEATLETRAAAFLEACDAASPEQRKFINCSCGRDFILDYPNQLVAEKQKKSREFHDRADVYKEQMIEENGEEIMQDLVPYCPLLIRARKKEELSEDEINQFVKLHNSLQKRAGAAAGGYCASMARSELELVREEPPLPSQKTFWLSATLQKSCLNLDEYEAHLLGDIPPAPQGATLNSVEIQLHYTRVMRSFNGHKTLDITYKLTTDLDEAQIEENRQTVFQRGADRAIKKNLHQDWDNKTIYRALQLEMQQSVETALQKASKGHHVYGVEITNVAWSD
ncbi:hypothetical protein [Emcibacter nanhaiensis]|uniref:PpiC domain-containing protein n=1 Tax=Emcibacter nanhaiensis TaxID=1505037 RepID=A0A501PQ69_9PROT|nr:hypothetical protein [Emcibacter nanhaiensis]TPD62583.1 hypothetical protein FIV46_00430 [Emcibacter nanhaiensis]